MERRGFLGWIGGAMAVASGPGQAVAGVTAPESWVRGTMPAWPQARPARVDGLTWLGNPQLDGRRAVQGGMTAALCDIQMYPRTFANAVRALAQLNHALRRPDTTLTVVRNGADLDRARQDGKLAVILASQDGSILDASSGSVNDFNLENLGLFYDLGLRVLQLTHNERTPLGDSFRERRDAGVSRLGERVVSEMNRLGMLVDLSHCGTQTTLDAIRLSTRPCAITHAGCRALTPTARNKTDEEIRAVAEKGGYFGVFALSLWLTREPTRSTDDVVRHLRHALRLAGTDHVAFGSDGPIGGLGQQGMAAEEQGMRGYAERNAGLPGAEWVPTHARVAELDPPDRMHVLADALRRAGYGADVVDKICGENVLRVFREVCG